MVLINDDSIEFLEQARVSFVSGLNTKLVTFAHYYIKYLTFDKKNGKICL